MSRWHSLFQFETKQQGLVTKLTFGGSDREHQPVCKCERCEGERDREADEIVERMVARGIVAS